MDSKLGNKSSAKAVPKDAQYRIGNHQQYSYNHNLTFCLRTGMLEVERDGSFGSKVLSCVTRILSV